MARKALSRIFVNSTTDLGAWFNWGNLALALTANSNLAWVHAGLAVGLTGLRFVNECRKNGMDLNNLPAGVRKFADNKGITFFTDGLATLSIAFGLWATTQEITTTTATAISAIACFGVAKVVRGKAIDWDAQSLKYRFGEASGVFAASAGMTLAAGTGAPYLLYGLYAAAAGTATYLAFQNKKEHGLLQPDLYFAAAACSSIGINAIAGNELLATANFFFTGAYLSLKALKSYDGAVHEACSHLCKQTSKQFNRLSP